MKVPIINNLPPLSKGQIKKLLNSDEVIEYDKDLIRLAEKKVRKASKTIGQDISQISAIIDFQFRTIHIHF